MHKLIKKMVKYFVGTKTSTKKWSNTVIVVKQSALAD